jgi:hypothetical protein
MFVFQIRKDVTSMAIKSFFRVMWNDLSVPLSADSHQLMASKLDLAIFQGDHAEDGVLAIKSPDACKTYTLRLPPFAKNHELRVYYPEVRRSDGLHIIAVRFNE